MHCYHIRISGNFSGVVTLVGGGNGCKCADEPKPPWGSFMYELYGIEGSDRNSKILENVNVFTCVDTYIHTILYNTSNICISHEWLQI